MTVTGVVLAPLALVLVLGLLAVQMRRRVPTLPTVATALFVLYLGVVAAETLFPIVLGAEAPDHRLGIRSLIHLDLLEGLVNSRVAREQAIFNVILGVPFGVLVPFLVPRSTRTFVLLGFLFPIAIEGLQLVEDLYYGYQFRTVDINDVMLNWIGVAVGYLVFRVAAAVAPYPAGRAAAR